LSPPLVAVLAALVVGEAAAPPPPSSSALRRAAEAAGRARVRVLGSRTADGALVGAEGQVLTLAGLVQGTAALVELGAVRRPAHVLERFPQLGLLLLSIDAEGPFPAPAARLEPLLVGTWVVGLDEDGKTPLLGRVQEASGQTWFEVSLRLPPGSPVLDGEARIAGVVTARHRASSRVATLASVRAQLGGAR